MARRSKRFVYMTVVLELSLILGLSLYFISHRNSLADELGPPQFIEQVEAETCLPSETESASQEAESQEIKPQKTKPIQKVQAKTEKSQAVVCSVSSNIGGPYTVAPGLHMSIYHAKKGDNLASIAKENDLDFFTILSVNGLESSNKISIGQKLRIPNQRGIVHGIRKGESIEDIALMYNVNIRKIIRVNQILDPTEIKVGNELFIPDAKMTLEIQNSLLEKSGVDFGGKKRNRETKITVVNNRVRSGGKGSSGKGRVESFEVELGFSISNPCRTTKISSGFGYRRDPFTRRRAFHSGVDIDTEYGAEVRAAMDGTVTYAGWMGGYGKLVVVTNKNGYSTRYGHMSRINVRKGSKVRQGQLMGAAGSTGRSTGAHVHFEVRKNDRPLNPTKYVNSKAKIAEVEEFDELEEELSPPEKDNEKASSKN